MPDINHPVRHALAALGIGDDPAVRSLYYRWAGFMADVRWGRRPPLSSPNGQAGQLRNELLRHFNDNRVEMKRQMEILRGHVFAAVDHAKVEGAKKRAEAHQLTLQAVQGDNRPYPPEHLVRVMLNIPAFDPDRFLSHDEAVERYRK